MGSLIKISPKQITFLKINCSLTQLKITVLLASYIAIVDLHLSLGFFLRFILLSLYKCLSEYVTVYHTHAEYVEARRAYNIPCAEAAEGCEPTCEFWGSNPGPVRKKTVYY